MRLLGVRPKAFEFMRPLTEPAHRGKHIDKSSFRGWLSDFTKFHLAWTFQTCLELCHIRFHYELTVARGQLDEVVSIRRVLPRLGTPGDLDSDDPGVVSRAGTDW